MLTKKKQSYKSTKKSIAQISFPFFFQRAKQTNTKLNTETKLKIEKQFQSSKSKKNTKLNIENNTKLKIESSTSKKRSNARNRKKKPKAQNNAKAQNRKKTKAQNRGKKWTDCCGTCLLWDQQVSKVQETGFEEVAETINKSMPSYFSEFEAAVKTNEDYQGPSFKWVESLPYLKDLLAYVSSQAGKHLHMRMGLPEHVRRDLEDAEATALAHMRGTMLPLIEEWSTHRITRDVQCGALEYQMKHPEPGVTYIITDVQERCQRVYFFPKVCVEFVLVFLIVTIVLNKLRCIFFKKKIKIRKQIQCSNSLSISQSSKSKKQTKCQTRKKTQLKLEN